ncbi:MAG: DnaA/Hda family protein [Thermodesulfobacteriota bacterium]
MRVREDVVGAGGFGDDADLASPVGCALRPEYTFARFVVGESNREAYRVARKVARVEPGDATSDSLYLYGGVGVGKTHLATAIGHAVRARHGDGAVLALAAERLAEWWRGEGRERRALEEALHDARLLIVDDVQFLAGDARRRDQLLREVDRSRAGGRQVVLTCDLPPQATPDLALPLTGGSGAVRAAEIGPPDPQLRRQILIDKAARLGSELASDVATFIAGVAPASVRALEGALYRALEFAAALRLPLSVPVAARALDPWRRKPPPPTLDAVASAVAGAFGVPRRDLRRASRRDRETVLARQVAIYVARRLSDRPLQEVAADFGCRDHSAAAHACARVKSRLSADARLAELVRDIECSLGRGSDAAAHRTARQAQPSGAR